jgi:hypothetical protein
MQTSHLIILWEPPRPSRPEPYHLTTKCHTHTCHTNYACVCTYPPSRSCLLAFIISLLINLGWNWALSQAYYTFFFINYGCNLPQRTLYPHALSRGISQLVFKSTSSVIELWPKFLNSCFNQLGVATDIWPKYFTCLKYPATSCLVLVYWINTLVVCASKFKLQPNTMVVGTGSSYPCQLCCKCWSRNKGRFLSWFGTASSAYQVQSCKNIRLSDFSWRGLS